MSVANGTSSVSADAGASLGIDAKAILSSLNVAINTVPRIADYARNLVKAEEGAIDRIHLVSMGSGAAVHEATAYWAYYRRSPIQVEAFSSTTYVLKPPPTLTARTLVVLVSKSGSTSETLHAIETLEGKCLATIAFTKKGPSATSSSLAGKSKLHFLLGDTEHTFLVIGMYVITLTEAIYAAIEKRDISACLASLRKLPELAVAALKSSQDDAPQYAQLCEAAPHTYIFYAGADKIVADVLGKCVLREANRIPAIVEDAENLAHHTCELAKPDDLVILLKGGDKDLRPLVEKAEQFYAGQGSKRIVYDLDTLDTEGIDEKYRAQLGSLILYYATKSLGPAIAKARGEDFNARRFMRKGMFDMTDRLSLASP